MTKKEDKIVIYKTSDWSYSIDVKLDKETIWISLKQLCILFWRDKSVISRHINNIFKSSELSRNQVVAKIATTAKDWKTYQVDYYNLDMIISVWYRVNSKKATEFRIWATSILKNHILKWFTVNQKRLNEVWFKELEHTTKLFRKVLKSKDISSDEAMWIIDVITRYSNSWLLLYKYDEDKLSTKWESTEIKYILDYKKAVENIKEFKSEIIKIWNWSNIFWNEQWEWLKWIFWTIYNWFWDKDFYETIEEKAAHLLYFIIKDHPFTDWNKRIWAFLFILFLAKNKILFDETWERKINDRALVALTLLIAESKPEEKEIIVKVVLNLILNNIDE